MAFHVLCKHSWVCYQPWTIKPIPCVSGSLSLFQAREKSIMSGCPSLRGMNAKHKTFSSWALKSFTLCLSCIQWAAKESRSQNGGACGFRILSSAFPDHSGHCFKAAFQPSANPAFSKCSGLFLWTLIISLFQLLPILLGIMVWMQNAPHRLVCLNTWSAGSWWPFEEWGAVEPLIDGMGFRNGSLAKCLWEYSLLCFWPKLCFRLSAMSETEGQLSLPLTKPPRVIWVPTRIGHIL